MNKYIIIALIMLVVILVAVFGAFKFKQNNAAQSAQLPGERKVMIGEEFLEKNKKAEGVVTLPSGLQYKIIKAGTGPKPSATDTVKAHYSGKLVDGTEFDSSYKRGRPESFPLNAVIPGWTEGLQLMSVGSKWELYIPANLAYGEAGMPPVIGPNQVLLFTVELLEIKK